VEELSGEYGDELLTEKGANPQMYKPGISYHYVWVPFHATVELDEKYQDEEYQDEEIKYEIYNCKNMMLVKEGDCL
jgi:hypothetical protein